MIRLGTPKDLENYVIMTYDIASKIQEDSIFPIWRDKKYMYFEKTEELEKIISSKNFNKNNWFKTIIYSFTNKVNNI